MKCMFRAIPNIITITRIIMTFIFIFAIKEQYVYGIDMTMNLIILFFAICISDFIDGKIARKINSVSIIGAKLDVAADLLYIILSYVILVNLKILPFWFLGFVCFKFTEFIITSNYIKRYSSNVDKPFVFDRVGRIVSAIFLIIPGIACIYKCFEANTINLLFNCIIFIIFIAGLYSSYLRIKSCFVLRYTNNKYINK
ncbi:CDP-alcohol phosphatidyltransferase family protein [Clostridium sp. C2-6-12]|uniref:CDP-alcohol phosphatidyltransferase family protein n=1 Tax=Clostridium sp. C2-6-12 TaxID=2698832 RepID=UPI00136F5C2A|nr:CDP-alcohol phosphatidyltransferase family protein [Clostridium sp. C2-6-12]